MLSVTFEENTCTSKNSRPQRLAAVSLQGNTFHKKIYDSGRPETQLERRRFRFGKWTFPFREGTVTVVRTVLVCLLCE